MFNKENTPRPDKTHIGEREFNDRLDYFYDNGPRPEFDDFDCGPSCESYQAKAEEDLDRLLEMLRISEDAAEITCRHLTSLDRDAECEIEYEAVYITPYDRARDALRAAESRFRGASQGSMKWLVAKNRLDAAQAHFEIEKKRSLDPKWRGLREKDRWRACEGREERGGSVCLNSFEPFRKWISRSVMPPPGLVPTV